MDPPILLLEAKRQVGYSQNRKARGNLSPRDGILHQTVSRLPVANQVFLGSRTVDICQEGCSLRSTPQRRHTAHLRQFLRGTPGKQSSLDQEVIRSTWDKVLTKHLGA